VSPPSVDDWVIPTLNDIAAFLAANGMDSAAAAIVDAAAVVRDNSNNLASFGKPTLSTVPITNDNIVRFCIYSRYRL
jgi:hypothetical protein